jgi:hypothetical protein
MRHARFITRISPAALALIFPVRAAAQATRSDVLSPSTTSTWGGTIAIIVLVLVLILAIGVGVKLYDHKRKREEEALSAQAYLADAFLREFGTLPVTASVSGSLWRSHAPLVISIRGTVPTPELREAVIRMADQELSRHYPTARTEDQLFVDPLIGKESAGRASSRI